MTRSQRLPLTAAQHGIWLGQRLDPHGPAYWTAEAVELQGELDADAFELALRQAIDECDALHQRYHADGAEVWQTCHRDEWTLTRLQMDADQARTWMDTDLQHAPDLIHGPLFASALLRTGPQVTLWYMRVHHIALDGFGYTLLAQRVAALYSAITAGCPAPSARPSALAPVIEEDAAYQASSRCQQDRDCWIDYAKGTTPVLLAPAAPAGRTVLRARGSCGEGRSRSCQSLASDTGTDWASLMVAACAAWLHRESGARELVLGLPVMGRLGSAALTVPCMAMNIVPLRMRVEPSMSLVDLAHAAADEMRAMRAHQRYRYEHLKTALGMAGGRQRLFGAVINLMPFDRPLKFGNLAAISHPVSAGPVEDLSLTLAPRADGVRCDLEANGDAYDEARVSALHTRLTRAMDALMDAPEAPIEQVLGQRAQAVIAPIPAPSIPVLEALASHARLTPDATAIEHEDCRLTYAALLSEVKSIAAHLRAHGVAEESRVALLLPREPRTIAVMLAVLWAGGGYIPLDSGGPTVRLETVLRDSTPQLVVTLAHYAAMAGDHPVLCIDLPFPNASMDAPAPVSPSALAYIIYTSGSTGRPNGVMIERSALAQFVGAASDRYSISATDRMLQFAPLHFDASIEEIYLPLCAGATVVLRTDAMIESMPTFLAACEARQISVLDLPTAFWHELAFHVGEQQAKLPPSIRLVIIGGEAAQAARVRQWRQQTPALLLNTYGPTEATVICTTAALEDADGPPPIGQPLGGVGIAVVDEDLRPVFAGQEGELCLIGAQLARGYFAQPELTARRFFTLDAIDGTPRAYRTGDRVMLGEDGQLRYLGRLDGELKISGQRIDPLEIEEALLAYPAMREAAVVPVSGTHLTAFVAIDIDPGTAAFRSFLAERLSGAAIPSAFVALPSLPHNHNGKIDRGALRALAAAKAPVAHAAASQLEATVVRTWTEVLGVSGIDAASDFFALGGTSLQAIQVANRLGLALRREVQVSALFRHSSVAALVQALAELSGHAPPAGGSEYAPLLTIQKGRGPALFCIHPAEGLAWCYLGLSRYLSHMPIYGLQARGLSGDLPSSAEAMVDDYLASIRNVQAHGPYHLLGWSSGGGVAHALAVRLRAAGEQVSMLAMMDAYPSDIWSGKAPAQESDALLAMLDVIGADAVDDKGEPLARDAMLARFRQRGSTLAGASDEQLARMMTSSLHTMQLYRDLRHEHFDGDLLFFHATERGPEAPDWRGWMPYVGGAIDKIDVASSHNTMSRPAPLAHIGRTLAQRLASQPSTLLS